MDTITFYTYQNSQPSQFIHWVLLHKKIPFASKFLDPFKGEFKSELYLKINPRGKVPSISIGGFSLYESWAIFEFLEANYPEHPLLPKDPFELAMARNRFAEFYSYLFNYSAQLLPAVFFKPKEKWNQGLIDHLQKKIQNELSYFDAIVHEPWALSKLSGLDFALFPLITSYHRLASRYPADFHWGTVPEFQKNYPKLALLKTNVKNLPEYSEIEKHYGNWEKDKEVK